MSRAGALELDEFGRDVGLEKRMEAASRAAKRDQRRAAQAARAAQKRQQVTFPSILCAWQVPRYPSRL